jgi:hypothetical protein
MDVASGFGLMALGGIVTFVFFIVWFKAMESEDINKHNKEQKDD